jgi:hypothetical protein
MTGTEPDSEGASAEPRKPADADPAPQAGVLGNLPKKRPAVRSPRRADAGSGRKPAAAKAKPQPEKAPAAPADEPQRPPRPAGEREAAEAAESPEHSTAADIEGLARGGIAIAGGAASLGLRIAGRAAAALRDAVERR